MGIGRGREMDKPLFVSFVSSYLLKEIRRLGGSVDTNLTKAVDAGVKDRGCWNVLQHAWVRHKKDGYLTNLLAVVVPCYNLSP